MSIIELQRIEIVDERAPLHMDELLICANLERARLIEMVEAGLISPLAADSGTAMGAWRFMRGDLRRVRIAQRLISDLHVNAAGAALILDLIDERQALLKQVNMLRTLIDESFHADGTR